MVSAPDRNEVVVPSSPVSVEAASADGNEPVAVRERPPQWRTVRFAVWAVLMVAFGLFAAVGSIPVRIASEEVEWVRVTRIWSIQANNVTEGQRYATVMNAAFVGVLAVFVLGSMAALWYALAGSEDQAAGREQPNPSVDSHGESL